ncbi:unnamed protein product [Diamesa hyperborea]
MGIRHLEHFMRYDVPNGFSSVCLEQEIKKFQRDNNTKPILVFDLMGLVSFVSRNKFDTLCGGRHNIVAIEIDELFQKIKNIGAELVFFMDGPIQDEKYSTWRCRQNLRYESCNEILDDIDNGMPLWKIIQKENNKCYSIPNISTVIPILEEKAKKYGTLHKTYSVECDLEIAAFASNNPAVLAVIAHDSDFLIFPGDWRYFSINLLSVDTMITKEFNRAALREFLGLNDKQLVIFATLASNDVIKYEEVKHFHNQISGTRTIAKYKFPAIAKVIKEQLNIGRKKIPAEIVNLLWRDSSPESITRVQKSLKSYKINFKKEDYSVTNPLLHQCIQHDLMFVFDILMKTTVNFTLFYYNLSRENISYYDYTIPMFQRQLGIIYDRNSTTGHTIYSKSTHNDSYRMFKVYPTFPDVTVPPLEKLLFQKDDKDLDKIRFHLLKWMICWDKLKDVDLTTIPKNYLLDVLVLVFMKENGIISTSEADVILLTIKQAELKLIRIDIKCPEVVNARAAKISFLYGKIYTNITRCLEFVGLHDLKKIINFDGPMFHNLYATLNQSELQNHLKDVNHYRIYEK